MKNSWRRNCLQKTYEVSAGIEHGFHFTSGKRTEAIIEVTNYLVEIIKNYKDKYFKELFVIGPADPPDRKIIYLKSDSRQGIIQLKNYLEDVINSSQKFKKINIQFDFKA